MAAVRVVLLIFLSIFLVWFCSSAYFEGASSGNPTDEKCDINPGDYSFEVFQFQETLNSNVIYQHEYCPLHFMIFTILHPLEIISSQKITGSLDITDSHLMGWISLALWVSFILVIGYGFIVRPRPVPVYETSGLTDFCPVNP